MGNLFAKLCGGDSGGNGGISSPSEDPGFKEPRLINFQPHSDAITAMVAPGPGKIITGSDDKTLAMWDWEQGTALQTWRGHSKAVTRVEWAPRAQVVVSASRDTTIKAWSVGQEAPVLDFGGGKGGHRLTVTGLALSEDHGWVISGSRDTTVRLWDLARGEMTGVREVARNLVTCLRAIPGEASAVSASEDLSLRVWDCRQLREVQTIPGHVNIPRGLDVSPCGNYILTSCNGFEGNGCEARLWDRRTGAEVRQFHGHSFAADTCAFVPPKAAGIDPLEGLLFVTGSADKTLRLWDAAGRLGQAAQETFVPGCGSGPVTMITRVAPTAAAPWREGEAQQGVVAASNFGGGVAIYGVMVSAGGGGGEDRAWLELQAHTPLEH